MKLKIISGGQTGADRTALEVAKSLGFETGGFAPKGFRTEVGQDWSLKTEFGLEQTKFDDYTYRTKLNVQVSNFTVWIGDIRSSGFKCTLKACDNFKRDIIVNPFPDELLKQLRYWLGYSNMSQVVMNVAGNRASKNPGVIKQTQDLLRPVLSELKNA